MTNPDKEAVCCLVQIKDLFQLVGNLTSVGFYWTGSSINRFLHNLLTATETCDYRTGSKKKILQLTPNNFLFFHRSMELITAGASFIDLPPQV